MDIYAGVEGGGSSSFLAIVDGNGKVLCVCTGPHSNHWALGMDKCVEVIYELILDGFNKAGLEKNTKLKSLGLCLSGCEDEETNSQLKETFHKHYSDVSESVCIISDTVGSIMTASPKGGVVLIAGTGSNSLLLNEDGSSARCGGWGHAIGDEGGAYWIASNSVKYVFDSEDNLLTSGFDCTKVKSIMMEHFNIKDRTHMLKHYYTDFSKTFFASMCLKLSEVGREERDPLCIDIFRQAGRDLGRYIKALRPSMKPESLGGEGGLPIACVGSVFKSWDLLKDGFLEGLDGCVDEFTLYQLKVTAAIGATYHGAKSTGFVLPIDFKQNTTVMFHFKK